jgi:hypothetical protein
MPKRQRDDSTVPAAASASVTYTNKTRCLVFGSRGMTARYRHLLEDVRNLLPHHKKESKARFIALPPRFFF